MPTNITQTTINPIVPANAGVNSIVINANNSPVQLVYPSTFIQTPYYLASAILAENGTGFSNGVLRMPNALQIAQAVVCSISNVADDTIIVQNNIGGQISTVPAGITKLFVLLNQTTPTAAGLWYVINLGQNAAPPDASALAGYGLLPIVDKLNCFYKTFTFNDTFALLDSHDASLINWEGGNFTLDLDALSAPMEGFYFLIKNSSPDNGILTLSAASIDNGTSIVLGVEQSTIVIRDAATGNWYTVGLGAFPFSSVVKIDQYGLKLANGTAAFPSLAFITQPDTGIYSEGGGGLSITNDGVATFACTPEGVRLYRGNYRLQGDLLLEFAGIYP